MVFYLRTKLELAKMGRRIAWIITTNVSKKFIKFLERTSFINGFTFYP